MRGPVLLTGGSGFLGSHVADRLAAAGVEVRALVRSASDTAHLSSLPQVSLVAGSLEDPASLARAVRGVRGVIHVAGLTMARRSHDFERVNALGTTNLLDAVRSVCPDVDRFVHVSSLAAMGPSADGRQHPDAVSPMPLTAYGRSKLAAEREVVRVRHEMATVVIRPPVIHGPRDRATLLLYRAVKLGFFPFTGSRNSLVSTIYVTDCADACVRALDADVPSGSAFDVDDGALQTMEAMLDAAEAALGTRARIRMSIPGPALRFAGAAAEVFGRVTRRPVRLTRDKVRELQAPHWVCDSAVARRALGWAPTVSFAEGARRAVAWYRSAGWL